MVLVSSTEPTWHSRFCSRRHNGLQAVTLSQRPVPPGLRMQRQRSWQSSLITKCFLLTAALLSITPYFLFEGKNPTNLRTSNSGMKIKKTLEIPVWSDCTKKGSENTDICFITCIFGEKVEEVDHPANVQWFERHWCHSQFLLVTNLNDLPAPGWKRIVSKSNPTYTTAGRDVVKTNIVRSRHAKFLAWDVLKDTVPTNCAAVIYMDGYLVPKRFPNWRIALYKAFSSSPWSPSSPLFGWIPQMFGRYGQQIPPPTKFQTIVRQVWDHPWGLSQVKQRYFDGLPMTTLLRNLVRDRKDTEEHVQNTLDWFRSQTDDFEEIMPYYLNKYFAYDPNNAKYRELSSYFWKTYTSYSGLWRDQPLWAYVLHHFHVTPAVMTTEGTITKGGDLFEKGGKLGWDKHIYA